MIRLFLAGRELRVDAERLRAAIVAKLWQQDKGARFAFRAFCQTLLLPRLDAEVVLAQQTGAYGKDWPRPVVPRKADVAEFTVAYFLEMLERSSHDLRIELRGVIHDEDGETWVEVTGVDAASPVVGFLGPGPEPDADAPEPEPVPARHEAG